MPVNDTLASATVISGASGTTGVDLVGATSEAGEFVRGSGTTVWYAFTAPAHGQLEVDTTATPLPRWDTVMGLFVTDFTMANQLAWDDDSGPQPGTTFGTSKVTYEVQAGVTYYIQVDDFSGGSRGDGVLSWTFTQWFPGPWISAPLAEITPVAQQNDTELEQDASPAGTTADILDVQLGTSWGTAVGPGGTVTSTFVRTQAGPGTFQADANIGTIVFAKGDYDSAAASLPPVSNPLPPTAVSVEYETPQGTLSGSPWLYARTSCTSNAVSSQVLVAHVDGTYYDIQGALGGGTPGAVVPTAWMYPALGSPLIALAAPVSVGDERTGTATLPAWDTPPLDTRFGVPTETHWLAFAVAPQALRDGWPDASAVSQGETVLGEIHQNYQPPRYRYLYATPQTAPPLRQRQRASGLAGAAGPPLRQVGGWHAAGDHPPLRQRQNP